MTRHCRSNRAADQRFCYKRPTPPQRAPGARNVGAGSVGGRRRGQSCGRQKSASRLTRTTSQPCIPTCGEAKTQTCHTLCNVSHAWRFQRARRCLVGRTAHQRHHRKSWTSMSGQPDNFVRQEKKYDIWGESTSWGRSSQKNARGPRRGCRSRETLHRSRDETWSPTRRMEMRSPRLRSGDLSFPG